MAAGGLLRAALINAFETNVQKVARTQGVIIATIQKSSPRKQVRGGICWRAARADEWHITGETIEESHKPDREWPQPRCDLGSFANDERH